jgi:hypothetical protein
MSMLSTRVAADHVSYDAQCDRRVSFALDQRGSRRRLIAALVAAVSGVAAAAVGSSGPGVLSMPTVFAVVAVQAGLATLWSP